jgi:plasmid stabilization system protein ParE
VTRIRWTTEAAGQLEDIVKHLQKDNPRAGRKVARAILNRVDDLKHFPRLGRPGEEVEETRELLSPPYVIVIPPQG